MKKGKHRRKDDAAGAFLWNLLRQMPVQQLNKLI